MWDDFNFGHVRSIEFCINVEQEGEYENYQVPADGSVQDALRQMLENTRAKFEEPEEELDLQEYELSEKYAATETLVANLGDDSMVMPRTLFDEEGWDSNPQALRDPSDVPFYFGVFRDNHNRKLVAVRRAAQFKGVLKSKLIALFDDTLQLIEDRVFKLDHEYDLIITSHHVYILHPKSLDFIGNIEELIAQKASEKARGLGDHIRFANFDRIAEFVKTKKRAARLVAALSARGDLDQIRRSKFIDSAAEAGVELEERGNKIHPAEGHEFGFLELLDNRRYTTDIRTGPKEKFVASSRKRVK